MTAASTPRASDRSKSAKWRPEGTCRAADSAAVIGTEKHTRRRFITPPWPDRVTMIAQRTLPKRAGAAPAVNGSNTHYPASTASLLLHPSPDLPHHASICTTPLGEALGPATCSIDDRLGPVRDLRVAPLHRVQVFTVSVCVCLSLLISLRASMFLFETICSPGCGNVLPGFLRGRPVESSPIGPFFRSGSNCRL